MTQDVFVSHNSADAAIARRVCRALEASGVTCWIAPRDVVPGTPYPDAIVSAIAKCRLMLVLLSEGAFGSPHVHSEVHQAFSQGRRILPVRLGPVVPSGGFSYFLSDAQYFDLFGDPDEGTLLTLALRVRALLVSPSGGADGPGAVWTIEEVDATRPRVVRVADGQAVTIGRSPSAMLRLPDADKRASREHCRLRAEGGQLHVDDLGSKNGTYVNGERVAAEPLDDPGEGGAPRTRRLCHGDVLRCGGSSFHVRLAEVTVTAPEGAGATAG